jgi:hypothetical protein
LPNRNAFLLKVKLRELFPPDDPSIAFLLRIMAAANDLGVVSRLWMQSDSRRPETECETRIVQAENLYLFRVACTTA